MNKIMIISILSIAIIPTVSAGISYEPLWSYEMGYKVSTVSVSLDGSYIAAGSDNNVQLFTKEGEALWSYDLGNSALSVSISSDGSYMAAGSEKVFFFDRNGKLLWNYPSDNTFNCFDKVSISSDASYIAAISACDNNKLIFFNHGGNILWSYDEISSISVSSDESYIAAGSYDNNIYFFNIKGKLLWSYNTGSQLSSISISSDGSYIAATNSNYVYLFNREGELLWSYYNGYSHFNSVSISSDGSFITSGSYNYRVYFFNRQGDMLWSYETGNDVQIVSVSSDGSYIAAGSKDHSIYYFDKEGKLLWSYETIDIVNSISLSSDGLFIAAGSGKVYFFLNLQILDAAQDAIQDARSKGFDVSEAESLLSQAEDAFSKGDKIQAYSLAKKAYSKAIDIDQDGILNDKDFVPATPNWHIYVFGITFSALIYTATRIRKIRKKVKERDEKKKDELILKLKILVNK